MLFFRNPEIKRMLALHAVLALLAAAGAAALFGGAAAGYVSAVYLAALAVFLSSTKSRYDDISHLSWELDQLLHGEEGIGRTPEREGELALLSSEIYKLTVRLQEQSELLKKEKDYLRCSLADVSHQIRTPLTPIRMIAPRLGREGLSLEERQEAVREIGSLLARIEWLMTVLLKIARLESGTVLLEHGSVNVEEMIQKTMEPLKILAELKELEVEIKVPSSLCFAGDSMWSAEAFGNILKNCIEHTPEKGMVKITALNNPLYTQITIADNGPGADPEDLPRLFDRFYKGKNSGPESAGIGLALSRMIIVRQNGTIKARCLAPHGIQFEIRFYKGAV